MWEKVVEEDGRPQLKDPILVVALSTSNPQYRALYSHAREMGRYLLKKMDFAKLATLYASGLPPATIISEEGAARLVSAQFYHHSGERDIILLAGDTSPTDEQYEFCETVLSFAKKLGVSELISIGTRWTEPAVQHDFKASVLGFATDKKGVDELESYGVTVIKDEPAPFFASLVVALAEAHGMRGYKLSVNHGEPSPYPSSVAELLRVLTKMVKVKVDTTDLEAEAKELSANLEAQQAVDLPPGAQRRVRMTALIK